ncbi:MBL fold metallo-hydrolase [Candidatus Fermentibacteria bacterium]|nr:MBL fold metallo-hydrolase [Candidatus Fermentibacteria bacterium]
MHISSCGVARAWTWTRCWLAGDEGTGRAILVDPATMDDEEREDVRRLVGDWTVEIVLLTHGHPDHIADAARWSEECGAPVAGHPADLPLFTDPDLNGSILFGGRISIPGLDRELADGEMVSLGTVSFEVLHLPGHSPGSTGLFSDGHLISGDTLFRDSIGVDSIPGLGRLWGASLEDEIASIRRRIFALPPGTAVHPGHGPDTTVGYEMRNNPFAAPGI